MSESLARSLAHPTQPPWFSTVAADARITMRMRGEDAANAGRLRLVWHVVRLTVVSDAFLAQTCYRAKARLHALRVPLVPFVLHRLAIMTGQICIGKPVVIEPGAYIPHGQVVIDGLTRIGSGAVLFPWITIGLTAGDYGGPTIGSNVHIGTGAKVLGHITIGNGARIGANAVVLSDVPARAVAVGVPARIVDSSRS